MNFKYLSKMVFMLSVLLLIPNVADARKKKDEVLTPAQQAERKIQISEQEQRSLAEVGSPIENATIYNTEELSDSTYTLGVNDVIEVNVLRHPEVTGQFIINNEGKIQYEFVGDVLLAGKTKEEVAEILSDQLSEYIISPEVTVKIVGYNSKVVYVIGEVGRPGKIFMRGDTITVREALLQAGLPLLSAKVEKTQLFTPSAKGAPKQTRVDLKKLLYKGDLRENVVMRPGDTLFVPPTAMTKVMRTIQPVASPISTGAGMGRTLTTGF